jgi:hypothetical protein
MVPRVAGIIGACYGRNIGGYWISTFVVETIAAIPVVTSTILIFLP